jgi:hypothetical protein
MIKDVIKLVGVGTVVLFTIYGHVMWYKDYKISKQLEGADRRAKNVSILALEDIAGFYEKGETNRFSKILVKKSFYPFHPGEIGFPIASEICTYTQANADFKRYSEILLAPKPKTTRPYRRRH